MGRLSFSKNRGRNGLFTTFLAVILLIASTDWTSAALRKEGGEDAAEKKTEKTNPASRLWPFRRGAKDSTEVPEKKALAATPSKTSTDTKQPQPNRIERLLHLKPAPPKAELKKTSETPKPKTEKPSLGASLKDFRSSAKKKPANRRPSSTPARRYYQKPQLESLPTWGKKNEHFDAAMPLGGLLWPVESRSEIGARKQILAENPEMLPEMEVSIDLQLDRLPIGDPLESKVEWEAASVPETVVLASGPSERDLSLFNEQMLQIALELEPEGFMIDPQGLITEQKANDMRRLLEHHAANTLFDTYVVILGPDQTLPAGMTVEGIRKAWNQNAEPLVVLYHWGKPASTQLSWGLIDAGELDSSVSDALLVSSAHEGLMTDDPDEQLERFVIKLSNQLYTFGRRLAQTALVARAFSKEPSMIPILNSIESQNQPAITEEPRRSAFPQGSVATTSSVESNRSGNPLRTIIGLFVLGGLGFLSWKGLQPKRSKPITLPEIEVCPRLGAPHCGGGHPTLFFGRKEGS